jgi:hypothetical protein
MDDTYNGFSNWETHNVAVWIQNDEGLYHIAKRCRNYAKFVEQMTEIEVSKTPDGVDWKDKQLDTTELDEVIEGLRN